MVKKQASLSLAAALLASLFRPPELAAQDFYEPFVWKGQHEATVNNGAGTTVFWNEDDWDVRADTQWESLAVGDEYAGIDKGFPAASDGRKDDSVYAIGGDGSAGVGLMRMNFQGILSARLRNPLLISASQPGVVEFRAPLFTTLGTWWEVALTPSQGPVIGGENTSVPPLGGGVGHYPAEDSLNFIWRDSDGDDGTAAPGGSDIPCIYTGWAVTPHIRFSLGDAPRDSNNFNYPHEDMTHHQNFSNHPGPAVDTSPEKVTELHLVRLEFYPDRVQVSVDQNMDGVVEPLYTAPMTIPWSEAYVYLIQANYQADHHPQAPCWTTQEREQAWKDVHIGPVKYGRTAKFPKVSGTQPAQSTGLTKWDLRDIIHYGPEVKGVPQPNATHITSYIDGLISNTGSGTTTRSFSLNVSAGDLADAARAQLVYDTSGSLDSAGHATDGTITATINGVSLGVLPGRKSLRYDLVGSGGYMFEQRSVDIPAGALAGGSNTLQVSLTGTVSLDRIHVELDCNTPASAGGIPASPGSVAAVASGPRLVNLTWTGGVARADGYIIQRSAGGGAFTEIARTGSSAGSYADAEAKPSTSYTYRVLSFNRDGSSSGTASNPVVTPADPGTAPAAPTNLAGTASSSREVDLTWKDNANNEEGFIIEGAWTGGYTPAVMGQVGPDATSFAVLNLDPSTGYVFRVKAFNANGESGYTQTITVGTPNDASGGQKPAAPTNLVGTPASSFQVHLTWNDNAANETGYAIERSAGTSGAFEEIFFSRQANLNSYDDSGLDPSTTYSYQVRAFSGNNTATGVTSGYSNKVTVTTPALASSVPAAPSNLTAVLSPSSASQINVAWSDNAVDATGVVLERSINGGSFVQIASLPPASASYQDPNLSPGTTFAYRVRAYNGAGPSGYSNSASAATPGDPAGGPGPGPGPGPGGNPSSTGTLGATLFNKSRVMSPGVRDGVNDTVAFDPEARSVAILNTRGRTVRELAVPNPSWDGKTDRGVDAPAGLYVARITDKAGAVRFQKILIVR